MKSVTRKLFNRHVILRFTSRLVLSILFVACFFVATQDIQIFPGIISGLGQAKGIPSEKLPKGISEYFVETLDNQKLQTWYLPYIGDSPKGVVIMFHGNGDTIERLVGMQRWINQAGFHVYALEYRGYGRSTGWPSEEGLELDAEAVYHFVRSRHERESIPLVYFAVSIGTGPGSYLANKYPPEVLVLVTPFSSMEKIVSEHALLSILMPFLWYSFPVEQYVRGTSSQCVILAHGHADRIIPSSHTKSLSEQLKRKGVYTLYSDKAKHNDIISYLGESILQQMVECADRTLETNPT